MSPSAGAASWAGWGGRNGSREHSTIGMPDTEPGNFPCLTFLQAERLNLSTAPPQQAQNRSTLERGAEIFLLVSL